MALIYKSAVENAWFLFWNNKPVPKLACNEMQLLCQNLYLS
jgi:hypothetical protein